MRWKQLLTPVESLDAKEAKAFIASHQDGTFTLLDVRQPKEYELEHIPGSTLLPLAELADRLEELKQEQPIIVYCAVGGRSRVAAQVLTGQGFEKVYNLKGGIRAWQGEIAIGPVEEGMALLRGDEKPAEILLLAYALEEGLEGFYRIMASKASEEKLVMLFKQLSGYEESHKRKIFELYQRYDSSISDRQAFEESMASQPVEEGLTIEEFIEKNAPAMKTVYEVLDMAMIIEAQAYDLYARYAEKSQDEETKTILFQIAGEEKSHLKAVAHLKDNML